MWQTLRKEEVIRRLRTNEEKGLTNEEAIRRKKKYGENKIKDKKKESIVIKFIKQFNDFMIIILIIAAIVSAVISNIKGEGGYIDSIIIISIVFFNALMGVIQEYKAEKTIESLKSLTPTIAMTIRNGKIEEINAKELVPGDVIILKSGKTVPADCRIIESVNLKIEESSLTGESEPVTKNSEISLQSNNQIGEMKNLGFMATTVVSGHGKAIVTNTGMNTKVGKIANIIITEDAPQTPIQKKLEQVGKMLGIACLSICFIIFVIGIIKKIDPMEMFMTSVGLAVAAIPEGLPAIVTIVLSLGVTRMAKKNSIIKKLPAVETLGSSKVICSDKTGTLTQNKMKVVEINSSDPNFTIELITMCTDCDINNKGEIRGDPTEKALVEEGIKRNKNKNELYNKMPRVKDIPFDSNRKLMTTIHKLRKWL